MLGIYYEFYKKVLNIITIYKKVLNIVLNIITRYYKVLNKVLNSNICSIVCFL